jgi:hypothetical protein
MNARLVVPLLAAALLACSSVLRAADFGARPVVNSSVPFHELNFSPAFTPRTGYTRDLSLLASPLASNRNADAQSAAARADTAIHVERLRALIQSAQDEEKALEAKIVAAENRLKELEAERDALRARKEAVRDFIKEKLPAPGPLLMGEGLAPAGSRQ